MGERIPPALGDEIARNVQEQTGGRWVVWYGHFTGTFWAIPRAKYWDGHIEAATPLEVLARIGEVDAWFGGGGGNGHASADRRPAAAGHGRTVQPARHSKRPGHANAVRAPRSGRAPIRRAITGAWSLA